MKQKISLASLIIALTSIPVRATNLSLGADYRLRGVSIEERDNRVKGSSYYDQRLQAYLTTDLSKDVEASFRVQSITPWGMENSTTSLSTRYLDANGGFWVQNAFVRLPNIWRGNITVTAGRQPIKWGDGQILSDDDLGFDALRVNVRSPFRGLEFDLDGFTAKISEGLRGETDTDLHGLLIGYDRDTVRWEFMGLLENNKSPGTYEMGGTTVPFSATSVQRLIYGVRAIANLKDAYLKAAYYQQGGSVERGIGQPKVDLKGSAYMIGLGGKQDTKKIGRFGALIEFSEGSGDKVGTPNTDEAFRPTFASRWSGLERQGSGRYFAATFSDAYSPSNPFGAASASNDGLPDYTSGIQTGRLGVELTPWAEWTFNVDYFQYKAVNNLAGKKELGKEFDYSLEYRYSGLVTVRGTYAAFSAGEAFDQTYKKDGNRSDIEIEVKF
jgi:hypothetical protein